VRITTLEKNRLSWVSGYYIASYLMKPAIQLVTLLGLSALWLVLLCTPALAHSRLLERYPAEEAVLAEPPEQVQLRFNEPIEAEFSPLKVSDQQGNRVDEDNARISPNDATLLVIDLKELAKGSYTVEWRVTSADGHPVNGTYRFAVDPSAAGTKEGAGKPIEPIERSAKQEEEGSQEGGIIQAAILGVVLIGAVAVAGYVVLRRR
jgi:methionine-rich copper-binding protein CopC